MVSISSFCSCMLYIRLIISSLIFKFRSIASSKLSSPKSAILSFLLQLTVSSCSLGPSNSCLRLLPYLLVPLIFPSMMCFRRQFLRNMCPIQLAFFHLIVWRMFLSSFTLCNTASLFTRSLIWWPYWYLLNVVNYEATLYSALSTLLLVPLFGPNILLIILFWNAYSSLYGSTALWTLAAFSVS
jgi:hypothetical protein